MNSLEKLAHKNILVQAMRKIAAADFNVGADSQGPYTSVSARGTAGPVKAQGKFKHRPLTRGTSAAGGVSASQTFGKVKVDGTASGSIKSGGRPIGSGRISATYNESPTKTIKGAISTGRGGPQFRGSVTKDFGAGGVGSGLARISKKGLTFGGKYQRQLTPRYSANIGATATSNFGGPFIPKKSTLEGGFKGKNFGLQFSRARDYQDPKNPNKNRFSVTPNFSGSF